MSFSTSMWSVGIVYRCLKLQPVQLDDIHIVIAIRRLPNGFVPLAWVHAAKKVEHHLILIESKLLFPANGIQEVL